MLTINDLQSGTLIVLEGHPYEVMTARHVFKAQDVTTLQTKLRDLINGKVIEKSFHKEDRFEEADIKKEEARFIFSHRGQYTFSKLNDPSKRFTLQEGQIADIASFLVPNTEITAISFEDKIINIILPIKIRIKIKDAPPGVKGDRAQGGTKSAVLETGYEIQVPLFIEAGDVVEVNTQTGEYVQRVEKGNA